MWIALEDGMALAPFFWREGLFCISESYAGICSGDVALGRCIITDKNREKTFVLFHLYIMANPKVWGRSEGQRQNACRLAVLRICKGFNIDHPTL